MGTSIGKRKQRFGKGKLGMSSHRMAVPRAWPAP